MKTLHNHIILYDAECPMCKLYTRGFVKSGMLSESGREAYQKMPERVCPYVDRNRAVNEIALVNIQTGEVLYGIDSMIKIICNAYPILNPILQWRPLSWFLRKLYAFISYNRRVIIPATHKIEGNDIQPAFRKSYRILYLIFAWILTALILSRYAFQLQELVPTGKWYREWLVCGGQILFQGSIVGFYARSKTWDYLGNLMTISLAGALALLPFLLIGKLLAATVWFYTAAFLFVAGLMFLEHLRRSKLLRLGWLLSFTWLLYRCILLLVIV